MSSNQDAADEFDLPPMSMDLDGWTPADLSDIMSKFTHHQEMSTPKGTNCYANTPEDQEGQHDQFQYPANAGDEMPRLPDHPLDGSPRSFKHESPPSFFHDAFHAASTPGSDHNNSLPNLNAGSSHRRGASMDTPTKAGTLMETPHTGNNNDLGSPTSGFQTVNPNVMSSGNGNGIVSSADVQDPFVTPSNNHRTKRPKLQLNSQRYTHIPDASDLILSPVPPPPFGGFNGQQPNGAPNGTQTNGHSRSLSVPTAPNYTQQAPFHTAAEICKSAECLITSLESIGDQARATIGILRMQAEKAPAIYDRACAIPNPEERKYFWDRYIGELRAQYDSIRDCLWCCVRYLVSRLSVWCKAYHSILPAQLFDRGIKALRIGKEMKIDMDKFRYPEWNNMAISRIMAFQSMNGNGAQNGNQNGYQPMQM